MRKKEQKERCFFIWFSSMILGGLIPCSWAISQQMVGGGGCLKPFLKPRVGRVHSQPYRVWNPKVSTVAIKNLVDNTSWNSRDIMMGAAKIDTELLIHQHADVEIYYVTKGRAQTFLGTPTKGRWVNLEAGSFLYLPSGLPHHTVAHPKDPIEILYVFPRDNLKDVKYVFDGSLSISDQRPIIGRLSLPEHNPAQLKQNTLVNKELVMEHLRLPEGEAVQWEGDGQILFVRQGQGFITSHQQKTPIQTGSYSYLRESRPYSIQSTEGLDILVFASVREESPSP